MTVLRTKLSKIMAVSLQKLRKRTPPPASNEKPAKKCNRFDGLSEEEVVKKNNIKDIIEYDLDLIFVGINPSLTAAHTGRYYAGPGNHFYKLLYESKLIPVPITYEEDVRLLEYKIGLTNIVTRPSRSSADLSRTELKKGGWVVHDKLKKFKPKIAVFNGKCIYEEFADKYNKNSFRFGLQPQSVGETALWVVPSSSARCANFPRMQDKLHFYTSLKKYLSYLKGEIDKVNLEEFSFEGRCKQVVPSTSKMWRRKSLSAFTNGGRVVNKETINMNTSEDGLIIPHSTEFIVKTYRKEENNDSEINSGTSNSHSDQEFSQNNEDKIFKTDNNLQQNSLQTEEKQTEKIETKVQKKVSSSICKDRGEIIDFVSLIKAKLNSKEQSKTEYDYSCNINESSKARDKVKSEGLKFKNLNKKKAKSIFKLETVNDV